MNAGILARLRLGARHGQILPIFALMLIVLIGMTGLAIDVAHVRSTAEDAQQAADAGALSGVAYLPNQPDYAAQQAIALTAQNNFPCNATATVNTTILGPGNAQYIYVCDSNTTITINEYPPRDKLQEVIATKVQTSFLKVLGYSTLGVTRSSTAQYQDPITMGAPDNQLGNANYPTHAFDYFCPPSPPAPSGCTNVHPTTYPQDFYLELRGPYTGLEHGDAFSPYFMTYSDYNQHKDVLVDSAGQNARIHNPCASPCMDANGYAVDTNPYYNQENKKTGLTGYSYLFTIPGTPAGNVPQQTLIKVLDPLDECYYDGTQPGGQGILPGVAPNQDVYANYYQDTDSSGASVFKNVTGPDGKSVSNTMLDQCGTNNYVSNTAGYASQYTNNYDYHPTTLGFTLYNPVYSLTSNFQVASSGSNTLPGSYTMTLGDRAQTKDLGGPTLGNSYGVQPLYMGPEFAHDGCTHQRSSTVNICTGAHAFNWFTLAAVTNSSTSPAYVMLVINSVVNQPNTPYYKGTYGEGGNVFALGICGDDNSDADVGNPADPAEWIPASLTSSGVGQPSDGCRTPPGAGYMVNARQAMSIMTEQTGTDSYIPLANIPTVYTGNNVILKLFDPGDVSGDNKLGVMAPQDGGSTVGGSTPHPVPLSTSEPYQLDIAAPNNSGYSQCNYQRPPWWAPGPCGTGGSTDYKATDFQFGSGPIFPAGGATTTSLLQVAYNGQTYNKFANDTFMDFHIAVPTNYPTQTSTYGNSWWKMYYQLSLGGHAGDTTTWEIISNAAPVHLIGQ